MPLKIPPDEQPVLNMTPMIDVVFLLIIFFMVGTRYTEISGLEKEIDLNVPVVGNAGSPTAPPMRRKIHVDREGRYVLDDETVSLEELTRRLTEARKSSPALGVIVRGDADVAYQRIADVLAACRSAGVSDLGISVRVASRE